MALSQEYRKLLIDDCSAPHQVRTMDVIRGTVSVYLSDGAKRAFDVWVAECSRRSKDGNIIGATPVFSESEISFVPKSN